MLWSPVHVSGGGHPQAAAARVPASLMRLVAALREVLHASMVSCKVAAALSEAPVEACSWCSTMCRKGTLCTGRHMADALACEELCTLHCALLALNHSTANPSTQASHCRLTTSTQEFAERSPRVSGQYDLAAMKGCHQSSGSGKRCTPLGLAGKVPQKPATGVLERALQGSWQRWALAAAAPYGQQPHLPRKIGWPAAAGRM